MKNRIFILFVFSSILFSCNNQKTKSVADKKDTTNTIESRISLYSTVKLSADLSALTDKEKQMIPLFIQACDIMDDLFWKQSFGDKKQFLDQIKDTNERKFAEMNYGPWERLKNNESFIDGFQEKPKGCNYYPSNLTSDEFNKFQDPDKNSPYTFIRRDSLGKLFCLPYSQAYAGELKKAAELLKKAATYSDDPKFKNYLNLRAEAFLSNRYKESDLAWMDLNNNSLDLIIGPIEQYDDAFAGLKASFQGLILVKDKDWNKELDQYYKYLPELQKELPFDDKYKKALPKKGSELNVYNLIYCKGFANSDGKTIAISLPNDEEIIAKRGTRNFNLKNVMKLKFESILKPIANKLIASDQQKLITFNAFFKYIMFQKMSHLMGIKEFISGKDIHQTMKEKYGVLEETKAHLLALYMLNKLYEKKVIQEGSMEEIYTTFVAGIFRSTRFGVSNFQAKTLMLLFNTFSENGAIKRNATSGTYQVNFKRMAQTVDLMLTQILVLQGNQDIEGVSKLLNQKGIVKLELQKDLDQLKNANIPLDVIFDQGQQVLNFK